MSETSYGVIADIINGLDIAGFPAIMVLIFNVDLLKYEMYDVVVV